MLGSKIKGYLDSNGIKYSHVSEKTGIPMNILSLMPNEKRDIKATEYFFRRLFYHLLDEELKRNENWTN